MSNEIIPVLAKDDLLLADSAVAFEVLKGASSVTVQRFPFTSQSPTSHVYNIQVPSTNVVMSREIMWGSDISVTISGIPAANKFLVNYGAFDSFAPFPLNQLTTNTSIQINNTTVSLQNRDVLDPLLRNMSRGELSRYKSTTPIYLDNYADYAQLNGVISQVSNSPFGSYYQASDPNYPPRGAYPVTITGDNTVGDGTLRKTCTVTIRVCEPLMVSPFVFGDAAHSAAGIYGVSQINVQTSMDALGVRAFRWILGADGSSGAGAKTVTAISYANSYLECRFLTPKPSDLLPAINVLPAANFVNYKTTGNASLAGGALTTLTSNNVQLNAIPDKAIIFVRETTANQQWYDADSYCAIKSVRILFNNQSGLLSSASEVELYRMSVEAGCNQNWLEYSGKANVNKTQEYYNNPGTVATAIYRHDTSGDAVSTTGSMLVLDFAKHIAIAEDYYAPSSLGQFSFQIQVDIENTTNGAIVPELNTLFMTSGVFSTQNGTSACYWGVLNKEEVLKVSTTEPVGKAAMGRMVGGSIFSKLKSFAAKALPFLAPMAKQALAKIEHPAAKAAHGALSNLGYGDMSGSAMSGAAMTAAGRKKALVKHLM